MKSHELFQRMSPETATEILTYLQREQKPVYKAAIQGLANQRNLRPVFVERKFPSERHAWMKAALSRALSDALATHLVQAWLLAAHKPMLCDFLDSLGIAHDEDGTVEVIPPAPAKEKIAAAVSQLLGKYPAEAVAIYLHAFQQMDREVNWQPLDEVLSENPQLQFAPPAVSFPAS